MSGKTPEFRPLPRRNGGSRRRRKPQEVGASTPSAARRTRRPRGAAGGVGDSGATPRRVPTPRKRRKRRFGWAAYAAFALFIGIGVIALANLQPTAPAPPDNFTPDPNAAIVPTSDSFLPILRLPQLPTAEPTRRPTSTIPEVAIVAGHWARESNDGVPVVQDSGAVCPDGLREVEITKSVTDKTLAIMAGRGYHVVLLEEFDPLYQQSNPRFKPKVFLSIHADSCLGGADYTFATGYKIAHAEPSNNEVQDARLVTCLIKSYDRVAMNYNLAFNANTITPNMTEYHAFRKIDPTTPAAIIELGFLGQDRDVLLNRQDDLARGLALGLDEFLRGGTCLPETATPAPTETTIP